MNCRGCGFEVSSDFVFCPGCGKRLASDCPSCGFECPLGFAFCPQCGTGLGPEPVASHVPGPDVRAGPSSAAGAETDRRPVSVLFADLCGFTTLCERLDPEDVHTLQNQLFAELSAAVEHYGGYIERFVGDSLLALFGAPTAHEDDPERALRAALDMFERTTALSRQWEGRAGRPLALHIGVNSGPAVVGVVGAGSAEAYSVTGDTANTGARLQASAGDGEILVGPLTYRLTQHAFAFEPVGELNLKGKAEPLPAHRLIGAREVARPKRGLEALGLVAPMIGRDDELAQLLGTFQRMVDGRAQVVRLVGDAGVGKSRLIGAFLESLEAEGKIEGKTVRRADCSSLGDPPYGFLASILRDAYGIAPDAPLAEARDKLDVGLMELEADESTISQIASLLGYVLGIESDTLRHVPPDQLKRQIFLAARNLFQVRIRHGPVLLIVEDLQWADAASIELLRFLTDRLHDRPLMVALSHRPEFDAGELANTRAAHNAMRLQPLPGEDTERILHALLGGSIPTMPERTRKTIVERAGGIALYVEEIARTLIEEGALVRDGSVWRFVGDASGLDIPPTIRGQLLARVDRLPSDARRLIQEASVLGSHFYRAELEAVASDATGLEGTLELLCESELLEESLRGPRGDRQDPAETSYRFAQSMVQEVVYENLLLQRRTELHARAGDALESACAGKPRRLEDLEALGHHFSLSPDKVRGARYLMAAGDWARGIYANDDAVRHYRRALVSLETVDPNGGDALAARERLGDLLMPAGEREEASAHYEAALEAFSANGDRPGAARCLRKIAGLHWEAGDRKLARDCCRKGLALLEGVERHLELAHLYQEMGRFAFRDGDNPQAVEWATKALEQAETLAREGAEANGVDARERQEQISAVMSYASNTLGIALARTGHLSDAIACVERSIAVAEANDLLHAACRGYANLGVLQSRLDPGQAIECSLKGLEIADKIGDLGFQSRLNANLAGAYCTFTGRCEVDGVAAAQRSVDLDRALGLHDHLAVPLLVLGQIYHCHGDPKRATSYYREAMTIAEESGEPQLLFPCYDGMAMASLDMGDDAGAEKFLRKAQSVCERWALDPDDLTVLPFLF